MVRGSRVRIGAGAFSLATLASPLNAGVCDTLVRMTETLGIESMVAERWSYDEASNAYQFILR